MIKLLHGADFHLDSAFSALRPEQAAQRRKEQRLALEQLAQLGADCDIVLLSGDLFDSARVYRDTLDALKKLFRSLKAEVFIAPGNHDYVTPGSPYLTEDWGENVHIFTSARIRKYSLPHLNCDVYGAAFAGTEQPVLPEGFRVQDPGRCNLMVLHGDLQPVSLYNALSPEQIAGSGLDYLALGHIHSHSTRKIGATLCAYPGCLMGRGFDECGEKGVYVLELDKGHCRTSFIPLDVPKYEIRTVEAGKDPFAAIRAILPGDTRRDCYRIDLTGEADSIDLSLLEERLRGEFFSLSIRDRTLPTGQLWAGAQEDNLRGQFLRMLKAQYDNGDEAQRAKLAQAARLVTALMDRREVPL